MVAGVVAEASGSSRLQASVRVNSGEAFAADVGEVVEEALADQYAVASGAQERRGAFIEAFYGDAGVRELVVGVVVESLVAAWGKLGVRAAG